MPPTLSLQSAVVGSPWPFLNYALIAVHADSDGRHLLEDVPLEIKLHHPVWLAERVELDFVGIETGRQVNDRCRVTGLEIGALTARNQLDFDVLGALSKDAERDELIAAHIVGDEFAVLFGLPEHLHIDPLPLVRDAQFVTESSLS